MTEEDSLAEQFEQQADSVGLALLVVLETLTPAEQLAFVLHDMFAVPFDEIAPMVGRSPTAARQLASRARRRVQGEAPRPTDDLPRQRAVVDAFFAAARQALTFARLSPYVQPVLVNGAAGVLVAPNGRPCTVMGLTVVEGRIATIEAMSDPERLKLLDLTVLDA